MTAKLLRIIGTIALIAFIAIGMVSCSEYQRQFRAGGLARLAEHNRTNPDQHLNARQMQRLFEPSSARLFVIFIRWAAVGLIIKVVLSKIANSKEPSYGSGYYGSSYSGLGNSNHRQTKEERAAEMIAMSLRGDPDSRASRELRKEASKLMEGK